MPPPNPQPYSVSTPGKRALLSKVCIILLIPATNGILYRSLTCTGTTVFEQCDASAHASDNINMMDNDDTKCSRIYTFQHLLIFMCILYRVSLELLAII